MKDGNDTKDSELRFRRPILVIFLLVLIFSVDCLHTFVPVTYRLTVRAVTLWFVLGRGTTNVGGFRD